MELAEIFLLSVGSMFWPFLLAVDVIAFQTSRPPAILVAFLAGGLLTTVALGIAVVSALEQTALVTTSRHATSAAVDLTIGVLCLVAAAVIRRGGRKPRTAPSTPPTPGRFEKLVVRGGPIAFVVGIVANVIPGVLPLIALKNIAQLDYSTAETVAVIVGFYLVMFTFVEVPIVGYLVAPAWTNRAVDSFNRWLARNLRTLAWSALAVFGTLEVVHGLIEVLRVS
jgi:hypothetical protein